MRFIWMTGVLVVFGVTAAADVLQTRDGQRLVGKYRGGSQQSIHFEIDGRVEIVPLEGLKSLTFEGSSAPQTQAPAPTLPPAAPATPSTAPSAATTPPPETVPAPQIARIPAGTKLRVRILDAIDPRLAAEGDRFSATLETGLALDHTAFAPIGSKVYGQVAELHATGPVASRLKLELNQLTIQGQLFDVVTGPHQLAQPEEDPGPASASTIPVRPGFAPGTLLEFRLLQPLEVQIR